MHQSLIIVVLGLLVSGLTHAAGTRAGTAITNQAQVSFEIGAVAQTGSSNIVTIDVAEIVDVNVLIQTPERLVSAGATTQPLYFTLTNTGNGSEAFSLSAVTAITGDDYDPLASSPSIVFDSDSDGAFSVSDMPYVLGSNEPVLEPDASIGVFVVADMPAGLTDGWIGLTDLQAHSLTGTGSAGDLLPGAGDGGVDVLLGISGGMDESRGEYLVGQVSLSLTKVATVVSPEGDSRAVPGALLTYTIQVAANGTGSAVDAMFRDAIPQYTQFVPGSLTLNGLPLSDAPDADSGEFNAATPEVVVRLGDLHVSDPAQIVEFTVSID